jgi:copper chaperone CopZ
MASFEASISDSVFGDFFGDSCAMTRKTTKRHIHKGVAHHLPHRTRYRLSRRYRDEDHAGRVAEVVKSVPGVKSVEVNPRTGSVLVHHDEHPAILDSMSTAIDELGQDIFVEVLESELDEIVPGASIVAHFIKQNAGHLDSLVAEFTNNLLDLKMLLPIAFLSAGIFQASRNRYWLQQVPAWVLFYYAYDSYLKFHGPSVQRPESLQPAGNGPLLRLKPAPPTVPGE